LEQQLLLRNNDSKESLVKSLELIAFPSSAHNSGQASQAPEIQMGDCSHRTLPQFRNLHDMSTIQQNESLILESEDKALGEMKTNQMTTGSMQKQPFQNRYLLLMNGGNANNRNETDLPLNSRAIPKHTSSHGTSHATTATTSTYALDEVGSQKENRCKNQKLMDELANLKSEIGMLKQLQNDQS
jgi:hypothetical protein